MRIELPKSGGWVDLAESFKGSTARRTRGAVTVKVTENGQRLFSGDSEMAMLDAFLAEAITAWSLEEQGIPIPSKNASGADAIGDQLDDEDYAYLHEQAQPLMTRVLGRPKPPSALAPSPS